MPDNNISQHYQHGSLLDSIASGVEDLGKNETTITIEDLSAVDEFHIGGSEASVHFLDQLGIKDNHKLLDIGCGLGGTARFVASRFNCHVTGIDITQEYIDTGNTLCEWTGLDALIDLQHGDAVNLPFDDETFNGCYMLHVGMNISDKEKLFREMHRVLIPGSVIGIYDVMRTDHGDLEFPVPWAAAADISFVATSDDYIKFLQDAGFKVQHVSNRREFALNFFEKAQARAARSQNRPALGLHILMGESGPVKFKNVMMKISEGIISPFEIIASK